MCCLDSSIVSGEQIQPFQRKHIPGIIKVNFHQASIAAHSTKQAQTTFHCHWIASWCTDDLAYHQTTKYVTIASRKGVFPLTPDRDNFHLRLVSSSRLTHVLCSRLTELPVERTGRLFFEI
ncbi:hypothetical protein TNIN_9021 [Trichonephila inaurata madagascariensis]|uniref:Uncharacterized protein n=1 Tax=Trichonephila inaurata madagascariensis TaxID=2747483 RepID=A0A8X6YMA5_9ARAC|nr:hypothetical protein TNIN_9021 [Trichonephila inaurata madagascariensis]